MSVTLTLVLVLPWLAISQDTLSVPAPSIVLVDEKEPIPPGGEDSLRVSYNNGLIVESSDGNYKLRLQLRLQFRYSYPFSATPVRVGDFDGQTLNSFAVTRGRFKIGGHAYRPWLQYYVEYDFPSSRLLTWRVTLQAMEWLQFRLGQYKAPFNRERVVSSGKQQFVERSIVTPVFTVDRQQGVTVFGRFAAGSFIDSRYWVSVFTGTGRGALGNDDDKMMWLAAYQWNFLGRDMEVTYTDVTYHEEPVGAFILAGVTNRSPYTRFSSGGGGELPGFEPGEPGQYRVRQWNWQLAFKYRGLSFDHEYHNKTVIDHVNGTTTRMKGGFAQAGYFFHDLFPGIPRPLEIMVRYAFVDPDLSTAGNWRKEYTAGLNWFFSGHNNKITLDASYITLEEGAGHAMLGDVQFRLQWELSL